MLTKRHHLGHAGDDLGRGWRLAFAALNGARRFIFVPAVVAAVPILVMFVGGDALSVCMNTVGLLLL